MVIFHSTTGINLNNNVFPHTVAVAQGMQQKHRRLLFWLHPYQLQRDVALS